MLKAVREMWNKAMQPLYDNLKREIKSGIPYKWIEYIEQHEVLEGLRDAMADLSLMKHNNHYIRRDLLWGC